MKTAIIIVVALILIAAGWFLFAGQDELAEGTPAPSASGSAEPSVSVSPVPTGTPFTSANVRVTTPRPNAIINSPLTITGEVRGSWMFEASFPISILDSTGKVIVQGFGMTSEDWMTTDFVPFTSTITFTKPASDTGTLVFHKDNPSGLPENDASVSFPIRFR